MPESAKKDSAIRRLLTDDKFTTQFCHGNAAVTLTFSDVSATKSDLHVGQTKIFVSV